MKKMRVGRNGNLAGGIIGFIFSFVFFPWIFFTERSRFQTVFLWVICFVFFFLMNRFVLLDKEIWTNLVVRDNVILLKRFNKVLQEIAIEDLEICFVAWFQTETLIYPALLFTDKKYGNKFNTPVRSQGYDKGCNYFLVVMNERRWKKVSEWYQKPIKINKNKLWDSQLSGALEVNTLYEMVEKYNFQIKVQE